MFRLLLSDVRMARDSELSDRAFTLETIDRLFARFRPDRFNCLPFLNSVGWIHLSEIEELTDKLVNS
jgi:hypothetical protein